MNAASYSSCRSFGGPPACSWPILPCSSSARCRRSILRLGLAYPVSLSIVLVGIGFVDTAAYPGNAGVRNLVAERKIERTPILEVCRKQWGTIILTALARTSEQGPFYIFTAFIFAYGITTLHASRDLLLLGVLRLRSVFRRHHSAQRYVSDLIGRKEHVYHRLRHDGCVRLHLFRHIDTGSSALIFAAIVLSADPSRHAVRSAGGADR